MKKYGGPAFPRPVSEWDYLYGNRETYSEQDGMTLWDYFAAAALGGPIASPSDETVRFACRVADAMLVEREKRMNSEKEET